MTEKSKKKETTAVKDAVSFRLPGPLVKSLDEVDKLLAADKGDLKLDFADCTFISVEGLEWLEEMLLRAQSKGVTVTFSNVTPSVYKVFKVAHIDSVMGACGLPISGPVC
ncbi:MAG TPA: STAS domain-containing protein [Candidatus Melainabacteria bacterium]|nr:STAS domain-containing protein [Candidatus Melainabacteria bacterium]